MDEATKLAQIRALESVVYTKSRTVEESEIELINLKKRIKDEKADQRSAEKHLHSFIRGEEDGLFASPDGGPSPATMVRRDFRTVSLTELGLAEGKMGKSLAEAGLTNLAAIGEYTRKGKKLTDLKHVGQGKADKIIEACEKWWLANPPESDEEKEASAFSATKPLAEVPLENEVPAGEPTAGSPETAGETPGETPATAPEVKAEAPSIDRTVKASDFDSPQGVSDGLADAFNECRNLFAAAVGGEAPKVKILKLTDVHNRFHAGTYIISEKQADRYIMQRVYDQRGWIERLGRYEKDKDLNGGSGDPPGTLAQCAVTDIETSAMMYISGEDEAFTFIDDFVREPVPVEAA